MKQSFIATLLLLCAIGAKAQSTVTLAWNCPTNVAATNFIVSFTTNLAGTGFSVIANIPNTNAPSNTNFTARVPAPAPCGLYVVQAGNFWGNSAFSNQAYTPVAAFAPPLSISTP